MKIFILTLFLHFSFGFHVNENAWLTFKSQFQRDYETSEYELVKKNIFMDNLKRIEKFNSENHSFKQGINQFSDMTYDETIESLGLNFVPSNARNFSIKASREFPSGAPKALDWRNKDGKNYVTPVRTQGKCTASWAVSAVESLESLYFISGKVTELKPLSVQQLLDCGRKNCKGGLVVDAYLYVFWNGIVPEASYPYTSTDGTVKECKANTADSVGKLKHMKIMESEKELINAIATVGPVSVYSCLPQSLMGYSSGIYDDPACNPYEDSSYCQIFQPMTVVGYGTENDVDFWIVKNCWGAAWGEAGYVRIARENSRCNIPFFANYPIL